MLSIGIDMMFDIAACKGEFIKNFEVFTASESDIGTVLFCISECQSM